MHRHLRRTKQIHQPNKNQCPPLSLPLLLFQTTITHSRFMDTLSHDHIYLGRDKVYFLKLIFQIVLIPSGITQLRRAPSKHKKTARKHKVSVCFNGV